MKPTAQILALLALAAPAIAQANNEPRTERPLPLMTSDKLPAPAFETGPAPTRPDAPTTTAAEPAPKRPFDASTSGPRPTLPVDQLFYTTQRDGTIWVSGPKYKASFGTGGASFIPFLGSKAPRAFPLDMSLESATANGHAIALDAASTAVRDGDRITIDRGPIDEVYEIGLESIEQTFVVTERPASGDLRFFVRLESEMQRGEDADGFTWSNELGSVKYSRAFVREADGRRVPVESRSSASGVEIVVGRDYLATATFPLVVDPVVSTFAVDTNGYDSYDSDAAYDLTTDRYLVVYERVVNLSDGDVYGILYEANGPGAWFVALDNTGEDWRSPQCANLNAANQFLMVAQARNILGAPNANIWGMTIDAVTTVPGWKFLISTGDPTHLQIFPDVGGDSYDGPGGAYYCVTWQRQFNATDTDVHARLVTSGSTLIGPSTILLSDSGGTLDAWPSVSKSNGILGGAAAWTIAWHRSYSSTEHDIFAAQLAWDGTVVNATTAINTLGGLDYYPRVSSPLDDGRVLVIYAHSFTTDHDIYYSLLNGVTVENQGNLTSLEATGFLFQNQSEYCIDSDGQRFAVVYAENYLSSTFDYDIWVSSFTPFGALLLATEVRQSLDFTSLQSLRTDVIATRSGGGVNRRFLATWDNTGGGQRDIFAGKYDRPIGGGYQQFCPGDGSVIGCPCANNGIAGRGCANSVNATGAGLFASGNAQTGAGDTVGMLVNGVPPNVTCTLFQGTTIATTPFAFNDGLRCVTGSLIRIRTKSADAAGSASWPTGSEADISVTGLVPLAGAQRYYQVFYRNAANFCTPATVNISNGMRVLWMP